MGQFIFFAIAINITKAFVYVALVTSVEKSPKHFQLLGMAELVDSMLDLMRRLPPTKTQENVNALITICPEYADDLLGSVDQPLQLRTDRATSREYLACDYNRDGESYRYVTPCLLY